MSINLSRRVETSQARWREVVALVSGSQPHLLLSDRQRGLLERTISMARTALAIGDIETAIDVFYTGTCDLQDPNDAQMR